MRFLIGLILGLAIGYGVATALSGGSNPLARLIGEPDSD